MYPSLLKKSQRGFATVLKLIFQFSKNDSSLLEILACIRLCGPSEEENSNHLISWLVVSREVTDRVLTMFEEVLEKTVFISSAPYERKFCVPK